MSTPSHFPGACARGRAACLALGLVIVSAWPVAAHAEVGSYTQMHEFTGTDGKQPAAPLVLASDGLYYGCTAAGGSSGAGTVFRMAPDGTTSRLHAFTYGDDGATPLDGLVEGPDGRLYGSASTGGASRRGVVFAISTAGRLTVLHDFGSDPGTPGSEPVAAPVFGPDGALYGTTQQGGAADRGLVYRLTLDGSYTVLWDFTADADPRWPSARLLVGSDGRLYGSSNYGGAAGQGTVFRLQPDGSGRRVLHAFSVEGVHHPMAPLVEARNGLLYGTAEHGGDLADVQGQGSGGVYALSKAGNGYREVYRFTPGLGDPTYPVGGLLEGEDGVFYGTAAGGGVALDGAIFRVQARRARMEVVHAFGGFATDGWDARSALVRAPDGSYLGTTFYGGVQRGYGYGTVFRWAPPLPPVSGSVPAAVGASPAR